MNSQSFVRIYKLTVTGNESIEDILHKGAAQLKGLNVKALVHFRIVSDDVGSGREVYWASLTPSGAVLKKEGLGKPSLVVITTPGTLRRIADGSYSPVQAYLDGKMELIGNIDIAKQIVLHLKAFGDTVDVCSTIQLDGYDSGNEDLTISGQFFTPGGQVVLNYNWGGGFYQQVTVANSNGSFAVTEPGIPCGDIPGDPGVGVIVTATDLASGMDTTKGFSTPC